MKWWVFILLPFHLLAQESYFNCEDLTPQNYQVSYDANKVYYWNISDGEIISSNSNSITIQWPDSIGTYIISVYTTRFGCEGDTSRHEVIIEECPYLQLFIPNTFTPNRDEHNDIFFIKGQSANNIEHLAIYNRWGIRIFEANRNIPWNGENCPDGVYTVTILIDNKRFTKSLTLIR
jgi:gliding motility-associated-like protein